MLVAIKESNMKNKGGRPTIMTEITIKKLDEAFSMGFSDSEACLYANISKQTLYNHSKDDKEFVGRKEELKNHPRILAKRNIYNSLKENKKIEDSKWYLERRAKKEFGNNMDLTTDGNELQPVLVKFIDDKNKDNNNTE